MQQYTIKTDADMMTVQAHDYNDAARQYDPSVESARELLEKCREIDGSWCWIESMTEGRIGGHTEDALFDFIDANTALVTVTHDAGEGRLVARCDSDHTLNSDVIRWDSPITAKTDSWQIAYMVTEINGSVPVDVDHDGDTIFVHASTF